MKQHFKEGLSKAVSTLVVTAIILGSLECSVYAKNNRDALNMALSKEAKDKILNDITAYSFDNRGSNADLSEVVRVIVEYNERLYSSDGKAGLEKLNKEISKLGGVIRHQYSAVISGVSVEVKRRDIEKLRALEGVSKVSEVRVYEEKMESDKALTGAEEVWRNYSLKGEGMVVAVLDTGIDYNHEAMRAPCDKSKLKLNKEVIDRIKNSKDLKADKNANTYYSEKVPFAYNYADKNNEVIEKSDIVSHGMHVAGIVGANGDEVKVNEGKSIKGVAPEAQILAMKIFSSNTSRKGCYSDDVIAAIEDAVKLGADVINLSIGVPSDFRKDSDPEQRAISKAVESGVVVIGAAGNNSYAINPILTPEYNDIISASSPGIAKDALMVANFENAKLPVQGTLFKDELGNLVEKCRVAKVKELLYKNFEGQKLQLVNCGLGKPEDFKEDINGKIALVKRGEIHFGEKIVNAQTRGAKAVVVYNNDRDDTEVRMLVTPECKIPAIGIGNNSGIKLLNVLNSGKKVYWGFEDIVMYEDNKFSGNYSPTTAWGPSPSLDFKPQISAPGENILSTINNNEYCPMGGTSMAAPHVSGAMALILESIKSYAPELNGRELVEYAKNMAMNTAEIKLDKYNKGVPFSPRRQGAGLIQIEKAIKNRVTATYNGEAAVALKEIKENKVTFKIDLNNIGDKSCKYTLENVGGVLTQNTKAMENNMIGDEALPSEQANLSFSSKEVVVPARGTASVDVTLNIANGLSTERFLEGFISFKSEDKDIPSISVPFMGFYGDWSKEPILSNWVWDTEKTSFVKAVKSNKDIKDPRVECSLVGINEDNNGKITLGLKDIDKDNNAIYDKNNVAISPNGDKHNDFVIPELYLMRNVRFMSIEILDENKNVVRELTAKEYFRKNILSDEEGNKARQISAGRWDGKIYDKATGKLKNAPEGQYYYRFKMKIDYDNAKEQIVEVPIKVDVTAPTVKIEGYEILSEGKARVYFSATDNLSGVNMNSNIAIKVNGVLDETSSEVKPGYDEKRKLYYKDVKGIKATKATGINTSLEGNTIEISVYDNAQNLGVATLSR